MAKTVFPGKKWIYFGLMILMILPIQVTLVPGYMLFQKLGMLGTEKALILPCIFSPLGTIIMTQCFKSISDDLIDQSKIDGCGVLQTIWKIAIPMGKGAIICTELLAFLDAWNMVEQPIAYLKDFSKYPLSVALAYVSNQNPLQQFACCLLVLLPPLALFVCFGRELSEEIAFGEDK